MSVLSNAEVRFLQGHKQISKPYEHKIRSLINRRVSSFLREDLPLLNKPYFIDIKANCHLFCSKANFLLAHKRDRRIVFPKFGLCNENTFSMSKLDILNIIHKFQTIIRQGQTQVKRIYEQ